MQNTRAAAKVQSSPYTGQKAKARALGVVGVAGEFALQEAIFQDSAATDSIQFLMGNP